VLITIAFERNQLVGRSEAIVMSTAASVKSSPDRSATELFVLHEGTKVTLREQVGEWIEVTISDGSRGWMPISAIEVI
jgi:hypothetical protein